MQPFKFGVATSGEYFTDRAEETQRLVMNFTHGINTILISPRRWGKTSLVKKACSLLEGNDLMVVFLDIFACRSESDFCNAFSTAILKQTASHWQEWISNAQQFLARISPKITLGSDPTTEMSIALDLKGKDPALQDVLQLPENIAQKNHCRIVVCIDEFQQIGEFPDPLTFQKKLRTVWQHQEAVSYCLFGSRMHLMDELFGREDYPFYKFGDLLYLSKISTPDWVAYICARFKATGKDIAPQLAEQIVVTVDNHSSYLQQLAWLVWGRTEAQATQNAIDLAVQDLVNQNTPLFEKQTEDLTAYQLSFLKAITEGIHDSFTTQAIIDKYSLSSSANVNAVKNALIKKELIDTQADRTYIVDPVLALWLKRHLFIPH
jgi:hypothetical protein